jgi:CDP-diacylglycerol--glycerol-3-phosphate 3-phosphatidyltransferase
MRRHVPNLLTVLRLILAGAFLLVLNAYRFPATYPLALWGAIVLFILAAVSDALDGYLARKWKVESTFGRILDPFCDKVLVLGAFIYLSGPRFVIPAAAARGDFFDMSSGVYPWMVAVMLGRELLVTSLRDQVESTGVKFPARTFGKLKMILQSIGVPVILAMVFCLALQYDHVEQHRLLVLLQRSRDILVYAIIVVTALSGLPYVRAAAKILRRG